MRFYNRENSIQLGIHNIPFSPIYLGNQVNNLLSQYIQGVNEHKLYIALIQTIPYRTPFQ